MFVFDMINSKQMPANKRQIAEEKMIKLMKKIYEAIKNIEIKTNRKILVFEDDFVSYESGKSYKGFGFKQEPFLFGDTFGFTIYKDSLDKEYIYYLYEKYKEELEIDFDFHLADGFYETNDYLEGQTKYFRGYCMDLLSVLHKENTKKELDRLRKKCIKRK